MAKHKRNITRKAEFHLALYEREGAGPNPVAPIGRNAPYPIMEPGRRPSPPWDDKNQPRDNRGEHHVGAFEG
jgi:hypothetical protein